MSHENFVEVILRFTLEKYNVMLISLHVHLILFNEDENFLFGTIPFEIGKLHLLERLNLCKFHLLCI